jgi:hypothetical protein
MITPTSPSVTISTTATSTSGNLISQIRQTTAALTSQASKTNGNLINQTRQPITTSTSLLFRLLLAFIYAGCRPELHQLNWCWLG